MGRGVALGCRRLACLICVHVLMVGACSSASELASTVASSETETELIESSSYPAPETASDLGDKPDEATSTEGTNDVYVSPIGEALGVAQDEIAAGRDTYVKDAEELVRSCMAEAGFDYTPVTPGFDQQQRQEQLQATLSPERFTAQYGFGIATLFELNFEGQGVIDFANERFGPAPSVQRSSGEQAAYEMALNGQTTQGLSAEEAQDQLFGDAGGFGALEGSCRDVGYSTAENPGAVYDGLFSLLGNEMEALFDRVDNDPRIREATAEWQTCMAAIGYSYEDRFEIFDELFASSNELANQFLSSPQVLTALGQAQQEGFVSMDTDARAAFLEDIGALQGFSWVPEVQAAHDELVDFELRVAADSQDCLDEDLFLQVQSELETEFVEQHADQLALIAAGDA